MFNPFDSQKAFRPPSTDLRRLAVKGAGATLLSNAATLIVSIGTTAVLARLLTPGDFGVVTMVTTFSLLFANFGLNGFTEAVIQREEIDSGLASNLFWINLGVGVVLTVSFAAAGSLLAGLYHNPLVAEVAIGISLTIVMTSSSVLHLALLNRAMLFRAVSVNDVVARVGYTAVAIGCAKAGLGYWALVAAAVAQPAIQSIGAWYLCRWVPGLPTRAPGTLSVVRFALNVYGRFSLNYSVRNLDNLLVGWRFDAVTLGFYKKAYDLFGVAVSALTSPLSNVAVSGLSRINSRSRQYREYFLNTLGVMAFLSMAVGGVLTLTGRDVIRFLLGPGWDPAGRIFTYFGPGIGPMLLYFTTGWIHLSIGRADRWFRWGIVEFSFTSLCFVVGMFWGPVGVAAAWTVSFWVLLVPSFWYAGQPIGFQASAVLAVIWRYILAALLAGCAFSVVSPEIASLGIAWGSSGAFLRVVMGSVLFGGLYLVFVVLLHRSAAPLNQVAKLLREMLAGGKYPRRIPDTIDTPSNLEVTL